MITETDRAAMRALVRAHGVEGVTRLLILVGDELEQEDPQVGPPRLCDIIDLGRYRRGWRRRDETGPGAA